MISTTIDLDGRPWYSNGDSYGVITITIRVDATGSALAFHPGDRVEFPPVLAFRAYPATQWERTKQRRPRCQLRVPRRCGSRPRDGRGLER